MAQSSTLKWDGRKIYAEMVAAAQEGVNETMAECVKRAGGDPTRTPTKMRKGRRIPKSQRRPKKGYHPNWENRTGAAEGSVSVIQFAELVWKTVVGVWGSKGIDYALYLERYHGPWLRHAADAEYPKLHDRIKRAWKRGGGARL